MRTTLVLDDDVAVRLEALRDHRKGGLKELVNQLLRLGLDRSEVAPEAPKKRYVQKTYRCQPLVTNVDNIAEVIAAAEGDDWR